jgi:hypothetical protein
MMAACRQCQHVLKHPQNWHMHGMVLSRVIGPAQLPHLHSSLHTYHCTLHVPSTHDAYMCAVCVRSAHENSCR